MIEIAPQGIILYKRMYIQADAADSGMATSEWLESWEYLEYLGQQEEPISPIQCPQCLGPQNEYIQYIPPGVRFWRYLRLKSTVVPFPLNLGRL